MECHVQHERQAYLSVGPCGARSLAELSRCRDVEVFGLSSSLVRCDSLERSGDDNLKDDARTRAGRCEAPG